MKRKAFIVTSAALGIGLPAVYYFKKHKWRNYNPVLIPELLSSILEEPVIKSIGAAYIKQRPQEGTKDLLKKAVLANSTGGLQATSDHDALKIFINDKITNEFKTGNTVLADGWILSETEARQCALFSLTY